MQTRVRTILRDVAHLLRLPLQGHQSQQKAWKVRAQTAPASLSCVPQAAFIWRMSTSTPDSDPNPAPPPHHSSEQIYALQRSSSPSVCFNLQPICFCRDQSWWRETKSTMMREDCVYSINISGVRKEIWLLHTCSQYLTLWLMFFLLFLKYFPSISVPVRWCSVVCLGQNVGLIMWIPEIFHYLSWWSF